jgi:hypothetical protein
MARKKTEIVAVTLRIREALRRRLETSAERNETSLNNEMTRRLEDSFDEAKNSLLLEALLAPGDRLEFLRATVNVLRVAGPDWNKPPTSDAVADAVAKLIALFSGKLPPVESSFPKRKDKSSGDHLAWVAVLVGRLNLALENQKTFGISRDSVRKTLDRVRRDHEEQSYEDEGHG